MMTAVPNRPKSAGVNTRADIVRARKLAKTAIMLPTARDAVDALICLLFIKVSVKV